MRRILGERRLSCNYGIKKRRSSSRRNFILAIRRKRKNQKSRNKKGQRVILRPRLSASVRVFRRIATRQERSRFSRPVASPEVRRTQGFFRGFLGGSAAAVSQVGRRDTSFIRRQSGIREIIFPRTADRRRISHDERKLNSNI